MKFIVYLLILINSYTNGFNCPCPTLCTNNLIIDLPCNNICNLSKCKCDSQDISLCKGNVTLINLNTKQKLNGKCNQWAQIFETCKDKLKLGLQSPWMVYDYNCKWIKQNNLCHSIVSCTSTLWCQENCKNRIKNFPKKCAWDTDPTKYPTKYPTKL